MEFRGNKVWVDSTIVASLIASVDKLSAGWSDISSGSAVGRGWCSFLPDRLVGVLKRRWMRCLCRSRVIPWCIARRSTTAVHSKGNPRDMYHIGLCPLRCPCSPLCSLSVELLDATWAMFALCIEAMPAVSTLRAEDDAAWMISCSRPLCLLAMVEPGIGREKACWLWSASAGDSTNRDMSGRLMR